MNPSPGKIRGLQTSANAAGVFTIVALDHSASFRQALRPDAPETVTFEEAVSARMALVRALAPHASAVLLDPVYGLGPALASGALPGHVGLLVSLEDGDYANPAEPRGRLLAGWSVAKIKRLGASAVKLFFYYHPDDGPAAQAQETLVADVVRDCRRFDLPLFAEPLTYGANPADRRRVVVEAARRISRLGIDVLKIEFPLDVDHEADPAAWALACQELSAACRVPWVLLSAGVDFETFAAQVRVACRAGASGYLAGRAIWQEAARLSGEARAAFLRQTAAPRLQTLAAIATAHARPWTDFCPTLARSLPQGWYKDYAYKG